MPLLRRERNIVDQVNKIAPRFQDGIKAFSDSPIIGEVYIICWVILSLWLIYKCMRNITLWDLQIRGTGLILGTEFTDNKSPNDPFPPEWGKFNSHFSSIPLPNILHSTWLFYPF